MIYFVFLCLDKKLVDSWNCLLEKNVFHKKNLENLEGFFTGWFVETFIQTKKFTDMQNIEQCQLLGTCRHRNLQCYFNDQKIITAVPGRSVCTCMCIVPSLLNF